MARRGTRSRQSGNRQQSVEMVRAFPVIWWSSDGLVIRVDGDLSATTLHTKDAGRHPVASHRGPSRHHHPHHHRDAHLTASTNHHHHLISNPFPLFRLAQHPEGLSTTRPPCSRDGQPPARAQQGAHPHPQPASPPACCSPSLPSPPRPPLPRVTRDRMPRSFSPSRPCP